MGDNSYWGSGEYAAAENYQSSSEYSSPDNQDNEEPASPGRSNRLGAIENSDSHNELPSDHNEDSRQASADWPRPQYPDADGYPTSDESEEIDEGSIHGSRQDTDRNTNHSRGSVTERRGKKGLTHAEMAIMERRVVDGEEGTDDAANDAYTDENGGGIDGGSVDARDEGEETEEAEDSDELSQRSTDRESSRAKFWADYHPVVRNAETILDAKGADPTELGYARLTSAGKGTVDYIVRKRTIVIGRSASMSDCTIKSEGRYISKRHAMLFWRHEGKEWAIRCLSDKNGILVNGVPVVPGSNSMSVKSRDLIEVGDVAFFFLAATSPVVRVNSIATLERTIRGIRESAENEEYFDARKKDMKADRQKGAYKYKKFKTYGSDRKKCAQENGKLRSKLGRFDGPPGTKKRRRSAASGDLDDTRIHQKSQNKWKKSRKGKGRGKLAVSMSNRELDDEERTEEEDPDMTEDEEDDIKPKTWLDEKANRGHGSLFGSTSLRPQQDLMSTENKAAKEEKMKRSDGDKSKLPPSKHKDDWNKKERTDFARALFAVGVDPVYAYDGSVAYYDWSRFRKIAGLSKKSDLMLENYYIRMMNDVHSLLEEEEQEKRTKGPRTKHKPGCDCVVCENTRKSRRKKREERENSVADDGIEEESEGDDDVTVKSSAKASDKLVGLVTAQKLRVRLSIHDAARQVLNGAGKSLFKKLSEQPVRGFPRWWRPGVHDKTLMRATAIHGVGQWADIWNDPSQKLFRRQKEEDGDAIVWPSNQAAMKRVREISSGINAELRREAKRAARGEHNMPMRDHYDKPKSQKKEGAGRVERVVHRRKKGSRRSEMSADEYEDIVSEGANEEDDGESTVESGSETAKAEDQGAADIPTEDDEVLEMEVEEEMEIEDDGDEGEETEEESSKEQVAEKPVKARSNVGDNWTDEEEEDEDVIQYETASDSGSD